MTAKKSRGAVPRLVAFKADVETQRALSKIEAMVPELRKTGASAAIRYAILETARRLKEPTMTDDMTEVRACYANMATNPLGHVDIPELRRRAQKLGIAGTRFDLAMFQLEQAGVLELVANASPASIPAADRGLVMVTAQREILSSAIRPGALRDQE